MKRHALVCLFVLAACGQPATTVESTVTAPSNLKAKPGQWAITFTWEAGTGPIDHYVLEQSQASGIGLPLQTFEDIPANATSYTLTNLGLTQGLMQVAFGEGHEYELFAVNKDGKRSATGVEVKAKTCSKLLCNRRESNSLASTTMGFGTTGVVSAGNFVIAVGNNGEKKLLLSTDAGAAFQSKSTDFLPYALSVNGNTVVAAGDTGIYVSTDKGANWSNTLPALPGSIYVKILFDGTRFLAFNNDKVAISTTGASWTETTRTGVPSTLFSAVTFANQKYVATSHVIGDEKKVFVSNDGVAWSLGKTATNNYPQVTGFKNVFYMRDGDDIFSSVDGFTWSGIPAAAGASNLQVVNGTLIGLKAVVRNMISYGEESGLLYTSDGVTWSEDLVGSVGWNIAFSEGHYVFFEGNGQAFTYDAYMPN